MPFFLSFPYFIAFTLCFLVLCSTSFVYAVKSEDFKTCQQSGFCRRQQSYAQFQKSYPSSPPFLNYYLDASTILLQPDLGHFQAELKRSIQGLPYDSRQNLLFHLYTLPNQMASFQLIDPKDTRPLFPLHKYIWDDPDKHLRTVPFLLTQSPVPGSMDLKIGSLSLRIHYKPFKIEARVQNQLVFTFNEKNTLLFENGMNPIPKQFIQDNLDKENSNKNEKIEANSNPLRLEDTKSSTLFNATSSASSTLATVYSIFEDGAYEENFKHFTDSKPHGPRSFGVDLNFPTSNHAFGLAEHATDLDLPSTTGPNSKYSSPYRLYNLDVFEYDMDSPMALYGSVPYLHLMSPQGSMGLLTLSASEMWIDIQRSHGIETHWMVESNPLEIYFWTAETPLALHSSFLHFTGLPYLPPLFSLGYHQSRWNYQSVDHVKEVDSQFDAFQIPYDVIWLDIEHTHEKRYFTWDPVKFKNHSLMIHDLALKHRRLVTIIDPHIKVDPNYFVSAEAAQHDVFVKSKDHQVFHGHCWPGDSNWIDFTQSKAVDVWIQFFSKEKNPQGIETFTWNDMNEPSVFSGPEITLPKDTLHGMYEHRDVHNLYGTLFHRATMLGQLNRGTSLRPFVLSRAFFVGTQKYGAVWTGDNMSKWSHLEASLPMLLSLSISGIHFSGADVGGFFGDPENELMVRWYQTAALQPFFRGHGHIDTKFREPYLFKDHAIVREAILLRYRLMPMLYTVFAQQVVPPMMPLFFWFHNDPLAFRQDCFVIGLTGILVAPVTVEGAIEKQVYLPGPSSWYHFSDFQVFRPGSYMVPAALSQLPVFVQGGHILVTRDRPRRTVSISLLDPMSLLIFLDEQEQSQGVLRYDDGATLDPGHLMVQMEFKEGQLSANLTAWMNYHPPNLRIERIVVVHLTRFSKPPLLGDVQAQRICTIKEPGLRLDMDHWKLRIFPS